MIPTLFGDQGTHLALNYTGSVFVGAASTYPDGQYFQKLTWLTPTKAAHEVSAGAGISLDQLMGVDAAFVNGAVRAQFTQSTDGFVDWQLRRWKFAVPPAAWNVDLSTSGGIIQSGISFSSCDIATFGYQAVYENIGGFYGVYVGDIIYDVGTGTILVVTNIGSVSGGYFPITVRQMNNMQLNPSTGACVTNLTANPTFAGVDQIIHTNITNIPHTPFFGTFTSGSANITNVSRGDGNASVLTSTVMAGDPLYSYGQAQDSYIQWPISTWNNILTSTNGSPGSATLNTNASQSGRFPILPLPVVGGPQ